MFLAIFTTPSSICTTLLLCFIIPHLKCFAISVVSLEHTHPENLYRNVGISNTLHCSTYRESY